MSVNSYDYKFALHFLKFIMIEHQEWKPHLNYLLDEKGPIDFYFQEKIRHVMSITNFYVKYHNWFENRYLTLENFKKLADLVTNDFSQRNYNHEDFLNFCVEIGTLAKLCYMEDIYEAPDYAIICIIYVLRVFREKRQFLPSGHLSFSRWVHSESKNIEKRLQPAQAEPFPNMNAWFKAINIAHEDNFGPSAISSGIDTDCSSELNKPEDADDIIQPGNYNESQNLKIVKQNDRNSFSMVNKETQNQLRDKIKLKCCRGSFYDEKTNSIQRDKNIFYGMKDTVVSKNTNGAIYLNVPSTSGEISKQKVSQLARQFQNNLAKQKVFRKCSNGFYDQNGDQNGCLYEIENKTDFSVSNKTGTINLNAPSTSEANSKQMVSQLARQFQSNLSKQNVIRKCSSGFNDQNEIENKTDFSGSNKTGTVNLNAPSTSEANSKQTVSQLARQFESNLAKQNVIRKCSSGFFEQNGDQNGCLYEIENETHFSGPNETGTVNLNAPSTSEAISKQTVSQLARQFESNLSKQNVIRKCSSGFFEPNGDRNGCLDEIKNKTDFSFSNATVLKSDSFSTDEEETIVFNVPKIRSSEKSKSGHFSSPDKLKFSPNPRPLKKMKSHDGIELSESRLDGAVKRTLSFQDKIINRK